MSDTFYIQFICSAQIVDKLFRLIDQENSGYVTSAQIMEFISGMSNTRYVHTDCKNHLVSFVHVLEDVFYN